MTLTPEEKLIKAFYENLNNKDGTKVIAKDFKNLQIPTDGNFATIIDTENNFELKSTGHYIIQTAQAIGVDQAVEMVTACSTDAYNAPELAKQWVTDEFNRQFSVHCGKEKERFEKSRDKRDPEALNRKIKAYENLVSSTKSNLSNLKKQALVAARMHTSRVHLGRPKSYNKMKDFFSDQETAVDLIKKLDMDAKNHKSHLHLGRPKSYNEMKDSFLDQETVVDLIEQLKSKHLTQDTETKSTDQPRPAAISDASTEPYDSKSDRNSPKPDSKSGHNSRTR